MVQFQETMKDLVALTKRVQGGDIDMAEMKKLMLKINAVAKEQDEAMEKYVEDSEREVGFVPRFTDEVRCFIDRNEDNKSLRSKLNSAKGTFKDLQTYSEKMQDNIDKLDILQSGIEDSVGNIIGFDKDQTKPLVFKGAVSVDVNNIACLLMNAGDLVEDNFTCTVHDTRKLGKKKMSYDQQIASPVIKISTNDDIPSIPKGTKIAVPFRKDEQSQNKGRKFGLLYSKSMSANAKWMEVPTMTTTLKEYPKLEFVTLPIPRGANQLYVVLKSELVREQDVYNKDREMVLESSCRTNTKIKLPPDSFDKSVKMELKVQPVENTLMKEIQKDILDKTGKLSGQMALNGVSDIMYVTTNERKPSKAVEYSMPIGDITAAPSRPGTATKKPGAVSRPGTASSTATLETNEMSFSEVPIIENEVHLMTGEGFGKWKKVTDVEFEFDAIRSTVTFKLNMIPEKVMLLKTNGETSNKNLVEIPKKIDERLSQRKAHIAFFQSKKDPFNAVFSTMSAPALPSTLKTFANDGFECTHRTKEILIFHENQGVKIESDGSVEIQCVSDVTAQEYDANIKEFHCQMRTDVPLRLKLVRGTVGAAKGQLLVSADDGTKWTQKYKFNIDISNLSNYVTTPYIIVSGGWVQDPKTKDQSLTNAVHVLNMKTGKWISEKRVADLPVPLTYHGLVNLGNGSLFLTGGLTKDEPSGKSWMCDYTRSRNWKSVAPMGKKRYGFGMVSSGNECYVVGGMTKDSNGTTGLDREVDVYNPLKNKWSKCPDLPTRVVYPSVTVFQDKIFVCGGDERLDMDKPTPAVQVYDIKKSQWTIIKKCLEHPTKWASAVTFQEKIYVIGGIDKGQHITTIEEINPKDKNPSAKIEFKINDITGRNGHASVTCEEAVYTLGGCDGESDTRSICKYKPGGGWEICKFELPLPLHGHQCIQFRN